MICACTYACRKEGLRPSLQVARGVAPKRELVNKLQQKKEEAEECLGKVSWVQRMAHSRYLYGTV